MLGGRGVVTIDVGVADARSRWKMRVRWLIWPEKKGWRAWLPVDLTSERKKLLAEPMDLGLVGFVAGHGVGLDLAAEGESAPA